MSKKHHFKRRVREGVADHRAAKAHRAPPGSAPGALVASESAVVMKAKLSAMAYKADRFHQGELQHFSDIDDLLRAWPTCWIDVDGAEDVATLRRLGERFDIHPLALEDMLNPGERPKAEVYGDTRFILAKMPVRPRAAAGAEGAAPVGLHLEQICFVVGKGFVMTLQEGSPGDCFEPVRERIRHGRGRVRRMGADYLLYALLDSIVDHYFPYLDSIVDRLVMIEEQVLQGPHSASLQEIYSLRRELSRMRRVLLPTFQIVESLVRPEGPTVSADTRVFLRDTADHIEQLLDIVESGREQAASLSDFYLSSLSNRMNEIMKVLSIIATIFIPLGFIAGLYGMNFDGQISPWNMPELRWVYGYPFALSLMAITTACFVWFFVRKGWIGKG